MCGVTSDGGVVCWGDNSGGKVDVPEGLQGSEGATMTGATTATMGAQRGAAGTAGGSIDSSNTRSLGAGSTTNHK